MKNRFFLLLSFFIFFNYALKGQDIRKNELSLNFGASHIQRQDLVFSPFIHSDFAPGSMALAFTHEGKYYQKVKAGYAGFTPMLGESYPFNIDGEVMTASPHYLTYIDLDYMFGKNLSNTVKSGFTTGILFTAKIQALNYVYGRISNFGYFSTFGIGGFGNYSHILSPESKLTVGVKVPFVSWLARSPFMVNDDEFIENISSHSGIKSFFGFINDGQFATWNKLQYLDLEVSYNHRLNDRWSLGGSYLFEFIHSTQPRSLISFRNTLMISGTYNF